MRQLSLKSCDRTFRQLRNPRNFSLARLTQTGVGDRKKGFGQESGIEHRFRGESQTRGVEDRLSAAIATRRGFASRLVGAGAQLQSLLLLNRSPLHDWLLLLPRISPRRTFWADRRSPPSSSFLPVGGGREARTRREGWERVGAKELHKSRVMPGTGGSRAPLSFIKPGKRENYSRRQTAHSKRVPVNPWQSFPSGKRNAVAAHFYDLLPRVPFSLLVYIRPLVLIYIYMREINL